MFPIKYTLSHKDWTAISKGANYLEFDWIGIDNQQQFAIFSSIGMGYIPRRVFSSYKSYIGLDKMLYEREKSTTAQIVPKGPGVFDTWRDWAQKGLFAYDYQDVHRTEKFERYDLIAIPGTPLLPGEIPAISAFDGIIQRFNLRFGENISMEELKAAEV